VGAASVEANVLGEHGTSETFLWSSASISGVLVLSALELSGDSRETLCRQIEHDVRFANIEIIEGNQASQFGIGMVAARIAQAVLRDERIVVPIGSYNADYGVTLSMPSVLGRTGVEQILEPSMSADERSGLRLSADRLRDALTSLRQHTHA
jgi:L-lactate dehydrogenase